MTRFASRKFLLALAALLLCLLCGCSSLRESAHTATAFDATTTAIGIGIGSGIAVEQNTSPAMPPVPQQPGSPMQGIETQRQDSAPTDQTTNQEGQP